MRTAILSLALLASLNVILAGCASAPPPPVQPAGVVLPPEVELSADEAAARYRPHQPGLYQPGAPYR